MFGSVPGPVPSVGVGSGSVVSSFGGRSVLAFVDELDVLEEWFCPLVVVIWSEVAVESSLLSVEIANEAHDVSFYWREIPCRATDNVYDVSRPNRGWWESRRK